MMTVKNNISKQHLPPQRAGFRWLAVIIVLFCELLAYTWVRTESTQTILRMSRAQEVYREKTSYNKALSVERDRLNSDDRITRIAKTRLNLSSDTLEQTVYLSGEQG
jgi:cell division protein FtsL